MTDPLAYLDEVEAHVTSGIVSDADGAELAVSSIPALIAEVRRLRAWKAEAMQVLSEWEKTFEAAGSPGRLAQSKAVALREEVARLRALSTHPDEETEWRARNAILVGDPRVDADSAVRALAEKVDVWGFVLSDEEAVVTMERRKAGPWEVCDE